MNDKTETIGNLDLAECYFIGANPECGISADQGAILMLHIPTETMYCLTTAGSRNLGVGRIGDIEEIVLGGFATKEQVKTLIQLAKSSVQQLSTVVLSRGNHIRW